MKTKTFTLLITLTLLLQGISLHSQETVLYGFPFSDEAVAAAALQTSPMENYPYADQFREARVLYKEGQLSEAESLLVSLLQQAPHPDIYFLLGDVIYDRGYFGAGIYPYASAAASGYFREDLAWYNAACCRSLDHKVMEDYNPEFLHLTRQYLISAFEAGYAHCSHALKDRDLNNHRAVDPELNNWIKGFSSIPVEARFLIGFFYPAPVMASDAFAARYFIYPDGRYEFYYPEGDFDPDTTPAGEKGSWTASVSPEGQVDLTLIKDTAVFISGREVKAEPESRVYPSVERGRFEIESPYDSRFTETISADGLGLLFRRAKDPDRFAYQKES